MSKSKMQLIKGKKFRIVSGFLEYSFLVLYTKCSYEDGETYYMAEVPALPGCITQGFGTSKNNAYTMVREAIESYMNAMKSMHKDGEREWPYIPESVDIDKFNMEGTSIGWVNVNIKI